MGEVAGSFPLTPSSNENVPASTLRGRVTHAETGAALSGATIDIVGANKQAVSDSSGNYELTGPDIFTAAGS